MLYTGIEQYEVEKEKRLEMDLLAAGAVPVKCLSCNHMTTQKKLVSSYSEDSPKYVNSSSISPMSYTSGNLGSLNGGDSSLMPGGKWETSKSLPKVPSGKMSRKKGDNSTFRTTQGGPPPTLSQRQATGSDGGQYFAQRGEQRGDF
jgi:hypothetical protein